MNRRNTITRLTAIIIAMTAIVVGFMGATGKPGLSGPTTIKIFPRRSVVAALPAITVPSQRLRFNIVTPDGQEQDAEPVRARLQLYDARGNALVGSREVYLSFGEFRSYDLNLDELASGTGRLKVRGEITFRLIDTAEQIPTDRSLAALELVDSTGEPVLRRGWDKISPDAAARLFQSHD